MATTTRSRGQQTALDMVRSLSLVGVVIAALLLVTWRPQPDPITVLDPAPVLAAVRSAVDTPVYGPVGLPPGWRCTSARWEPTEKSRPVPVWFSGYVTPADTFASLAQAATTTATFRTEQTGGGSPVGEVRIGTQTWQRYEVPGGDQLSLVLPTAGGTTVVSGSASWADLEFFAGSLRAG